jgi:hypothetical protein
MERGHFETVRELNREIAALSELTIDQLKERWRSIYQSAPPGRSSRKLLVSAIAYRMQESALGGLKPAVRALLERVSENPTGSRAAFDRPVTKASVGTVLIRDWRGHSYKVTVLDHGVLYLKQNYRSLSQVAGIITGTRWSGPRFFGLKRRAQERSSGKR